MNYPLKALATVLLAASLAGCTVAPVTPSKVRIEKAADLPRFTYAVEGDLAALVRDDARFNPLAQKIQQDVSGVLATYDIAESATERQYLGLLAQIALMEGRYDETLRLTGLIKNLQDKPADELLSGMLTRAILGAAKKYNSGVDPALFADQRVQDQGQAAFIAFDKFSRPSTSPLVPISADVQANLPQMQARSKGLSDAQSNIDSEEAAEVKRYLSGLQGSEYKSAQESLRLTGNYQHGTHVAGIAMAGNPYARLVNVRIEFGHTLVPYPCPTPESEERGTRTIAPQIDFVNRLGVRVVNMSWGGNVRGYETVLEQCNIGNSAAERKTLARTYFQARWDALKTAMASAPGILFVASAGNSGNDPSFNEAYPASIVLPNLITVGAVDKAGDEAAFTSYGPTVAVHANGYQVDSFVPGGRRIALSGTSMSAPQVTNLASKILAVNPNLTAPEVISLIKTTAEKTADGRRTLIHPAKALAAAGYR